MKYVGLQSSIWSNKLKTIYLIISFPLLFLLLFIVIFSIDAYHQSYTFSDPNFMSYVIQQSSTAMMITIPVITIWFIISLMFYRQIIFKFAGAKPITRKDNPYIYNIVENLCITKGISTPNIGIIDDNSLNAFATGWKPGKTRIVFSKGIIDKLNKQEIEAVAGHELTHILNKDTLLMMYIVVFIGIIGTLGQILIRFAGSSSRRNEEGNKASLVLFLGGLGLIVLGYLVFPLIRLAISRKREYLADAGSVELTKDKYAMISALQKISQDAVIESIKKETVAAMCIQTPFATDSNKRKIKRYHNLLSTHPSIEDRINALKGY